MIILSYFFYHETNDFYYNYHFWSKSMVLDLMADMKEQQYNKEQQKQTQGRHIPCWLYYPNNPTLPKKNKSITDMSLPCNDRSKRGGSG